MISLECLATPGKLSACQKCLGRSRCEEVQSLLPRLARWCGIDPVTGKPEAQSASGFDTTSRQDLFVDTLLAVEKQIGSFRGDARLSTWAYQIFKNKKKDVLRKKYRDKEIFQACPSTDDDEQSWEDWASTHQSDPATSLEDQFSASDLQTALAECFDRIALVNKNCGDLMEQVYRSALNLVEGDTTFEHASSGSVNFATVLQSIAHEYSSFDALKRRFYRCQQQIGLSLRQCLQEMGYGDF